MPQAISIRAAVHTDLAALFQPMARGESRLPPEKEAGFITGLGTAVGEPGWRRIWLAVDDGGAIAGHIDLRARPERPAAHRALLGMGVHRDHRRKGIGVRLIDAAMAWARDEAGIGWVDLEVLSVNRAARNLYELTGFATVGEMPDMFRIDGEQHAYTFMTRRP